MDKSDHREGAPRRQPKNILLPAIMPGGIYLQTQLTNNGIPENKLARWAEIPNEEGLYPRDTGTKENIYLADEIIDFVKRLPKIRKLKKGE